MKKTLLTGFGPFGTVVNNPTERIVRHFQQYGSDGHDLRTHVFPVTYTGLPEVLRILLFESIEGAYDNVLMLGVAGNAREWRIETTGRNRNDISRSDASGDLPETEFTLGSQHPTLEATLPVRELLNVLSGANFPVSLSDDAGGYLCNHLLYNCLHLLNGSANTRAGFLHVPPDSLTFEIPPDDANTLWQMSSQIHVVQLVLDALR